LKAAGLSQAELCRLTGIQTGQLNQWIKGKHRPSLDALLIALPYLDVTIQYILIGDEGALSYERRDALREAATALAHEDDDDVGDAVDASATT